MTNNVVEILVAFNTAVSLAVLILVGKLAYHAGRFVQRLEDVENDVAQLVAAQSGGQNPDR